MSKNTSEAEPAGIERTKKLKILVKPLGNFVMVQCEVAAKFLHGLQLPPHQRFDENLVRTRVLAVGPLVTDLKPGDRVYMPIGSGREVEHFCWEQTPEAEREGQVYLLPADVFPAAFTYVENMMIPPEDGTLAVVGGLPTETYRRMQDQKLATFEEVERQTSAPRSNIVQAPAGAVPPQAKKSLFRRG